MLCFFSYLNTPYVIKVLYNNITPKSTYFQSKNYVANLFREGSRVFIRALYIFDEKIKDYYYDTPCTRFDAVYENLPLVDTVLWQKGTKENIGLILDKNAEKFTAEKLSDGVLKIMWNEKCLVFYEDKIEINNCGELTFSPGNTTARISANDNSLKYIYNGAEYALNTQNCQIKENENGFGFKGKEIELMF